MEYIDLAVRQISPSALKKIESGIKQGYELVHESFKANEWMNIDSNHNSKQIFYNLGIDYILARKISKGQLSGFVSNFEKNSCGNSKHIEMKKSGIIITTSSFRGDIRSAPLPRPASFRESLSVNNQIGMWDYDANYELKPKNDLHDRIHYAIICHRLNFRNGSISPDTYIGIPDRTYSSWVASCSLNEITSGLEIVEHNFVQKDDDDLNIDLKEYILKEIDKPKE